MNARLVAFETFPVRPRKPTSERTSICDEKGQEETCAGAATCVDKLRLLDNLVGAQQNRRRQLDADGLRGPQIHNELKSVRLLDRNVSDLGSL